MSHHLPLLDATLATVAENLALDEALLLQAEETGAEVLRLWESPSFAVVLGAGCKLAEVDEDACRTDGVPIARRNSGGGTVVIGPGCLLYSLVLSYEREPQLGDLRSSFRWILERVTTALGMGIHPDGISDLVLGERKVSGNAQQRKRRHLLHHGTLLYDFDVARVSRWLRMPERQPEYRRQRAHEDFLANVPMPRDELHRRVCEAWHVRGHVETWPRELVDTLVGAKYSQEEWIRRR